MTPSRASTRIERGLLRALAGKLDTGIRPTVTGAGHRILTATHVSGQDLIQPLLAQLRVLLHLEREAAEAVLYCFSELLRNVFEHSEISPGAFVAAAHYPQKGRVTIAIADLGVTVPVHFRRQFSNGLDDENALRGALEPRASGSFDRNRNAGLGLYMTRRIADMTRGKFWMITGGLEARQDSMVALGGHADVVVSRAANLWKGTVVALTLRPDSIVNFNRTMIMANQELTGGAFATRIQFFRKQPLADSDVIDVSPDAANMAQDKLAAEAIRLTKILPALRDGKKVTLAFRGVALTTQSFIHALLAEPLRVLGPTSAPGQIAYSWCSDQVREVIRLVIGYVLEEASMPDDLTAQDDPISALDP